MTADPTPGADPRHVPGVPQGVTRSDGSVEDREFCIYDHEPWPCPGADPRLAESEMDRLYRLHDVHEPDHAPRTSYQCAGCAILDALALLPARTETTEADPHVVERLLASMPAKSGRLLVVEQWDDGDWSVSIPWMPGHIGVGDTLPEAYESAIDAAEAWSEGYRDHVAATTEAVALAAALDRLIEADKGPITIWYPTPGRPNGYIVRANPP